MVVSEKAYWIQLLKSAEYCYSGNALTEFIKNFIHGMPIFFIELQNKLVLRSRCELSMSDASSIVKESAISYRKDTSGIQMGRCNLIGEAVFYGTVIEKIEDSTAKTETACAAEVSRINITEKSSEGIEFLTTGGWVITTPIKVATFCFYNAFDSPNPGLIELRSKCEGALMTLGSERMKSLAFQEYFSHKYAQAGNDYRLSASLASVLFEEGYDGIMYPGVKMSGMGMNVALSTRIVDSSLDLRKLTITKVYKRGNHVYFNPQMNCLEPHLVDGEKTFHWSLDEAMHSEEEVDELFRGWNQSELLE